MCVHSAPAFDLEVVPVPRSKRSLDRSDAVAAALGHGGDGILLLERESRRQRSQPLARTVERLAPAKRR
jgi:hypothetical protein